MSDAAHFFYTIPKPMRRFCYNIILILAMILLSGYEMSGQEVLKSARIQAKANRRYLPSLGLPIPVNREVDGAIWYAAPKWHGADSLKGNPFWTMSEIDRDNAAKMALPDKVIELCNAWSSEKPIGPCHVVWGPLKEYSFVAICSKTKSDLNWKSIGVIIPKEGMSPEKKIWGYTCSVNWIEWLTGYNLFPKLPENLQEIVEEMTAYEHLCPFIEIGIEEIDEPEKEINYDWEDDFRESMM